MTTPATPTNPSPAGDDRNLVAVDATTAVTFEEKLHIFWQKYRGAVIGLCAVVVLGIVGLGAWKKLQESKQADIRKAYQAATTPEQLKTFSAAQGDHPLAGVAQIQIGDDAYKNGKMADAIAAYEKAISILKNDPLAARAKVGRAVAKIQSGKAAEGAGELKALAADANQAKAVRAEATYHLTSIAAEANDAAEVQKLSDQLMALDANSPWLQRAMMLRASMPPVPAAPAAPAPADAGAAKKDDGAGKVEVKLPGKK